MGLFKKKSSATTTRPEPIRPPVSFADGDLERCDLALSRFEQAYGRGQDAPVRAALLGIAQAGGWKGDRWATSEYFQGRNVNDQPWRWLELMAEVASTGNPILAARIALFFKVFSDDIGPNLQLADYFDFGLEQAPVAVCTSALAHGIKALGEVDPHTVVLTVAEGPFDAALTRGVLCLGLTQRPDGGASHEREAREVAASLLGSPGR